MTRDYDEEEQGYDSEKEKKEEKRPTEAVSPKTKECSVEKGVGDLRESKVNGDDHHEVCIGDPTPEPLAESSAHRNRLYFRTLLLPSATLGVASQEPFQSSMVNNSPFGPWCSLFYKPGIKTQARVKKEGWF